MQKGRNLADKIGVDVNFIQANILDFRLESNFDIIFCSGVLSYIPEDMRTEILESYKSHANTDGLHAMNVFVDKPFINKAPDAEDCEKNWKLGELMNLYSDWLIDKCDEIIFDCNSSGVPHKHCMDIVYAFKKLTLPSILKIWYNTN